MAEVKHEVDYVAVDAKDILPERQLGWAWFTRATVWGVGAVIVLLVLLKLFFG